MKKLILAAAISAIVGSGSAFAVDTSNANSVAGVSSSSVANTGGLLTGFFVVSPVTGTSNQFTNTTASNSSAAGVTTVDATRNGLIANPSNPSFPPLTVPYKIDQVYTNASSVGGSGVFSSSTITGTVSPTTFFYPLQNISGGAASQSGGASAVGSLN